MRPRVLLCTVLLAASPASAQVVRVSVSSAGAQADGASDWPAISASGRFVAFQSDATTLVAGDANGVTDVFVHDRDVDADTVLDEPSGVSTTRVSAAAGVEGNGASTRPVISRDGRFVVFLSRSTSFFSSGQPALGHALVFRADRATGAIRLVSQNDAGEPANNTCLEAALSDDGRFIVFQSDATNLAPGDPGFGGGIFLRDMDAGTTVRLSEPQPPPVQVAPPPSNARSFVVGSPSISSDGRLIAFAEIAGTNLRLLGPYATGTVTLVDRRAGVARRAMAPGWRVFVSPDGRWFVAHGAAEDVTGIPDDSRFVPAYRQSVPGQGRQHTYAVYASLDSVSGDGRFLLAGPSVYDFMLGVSATPVSQAIDNGTLDGSGRFMAFASRASDVLPGGADTNSATDVFVVDLPARFDQDQDTLDDRWEMLFGLSAASGIGADGAAGDPDGDGETNAQEEAAGSHPRGVAFRYLAEGAAGGFFETRIAVTNPDVVHPAAAVVRFEKGDGTSVSRAVPLAAFSRRTIVASATDGIETTDFSTVVESDRPLVVDRLMSWDATRYGSHAETSVEAPSATWFLAEGTTVLDFQLFYLLQNAQATASTATVRFLRPIGPPVVRTYDLPPRSRTTIYVNTVPSLDATDVSAAVTATQPIVVERAMYRNRPGQPFALGHAAAGIPQAGTSWFLAEGATGVFFDTYVLVANPSLQDATVEMDFLRDGGGTVTRTYTVAASSRFSVFVDVVPGLEATTFGTRITSTVPVVVERAMYWAGGFFDYYEGHVSAATTQTGARWVLAEGEIGGPDSAETYVLIANAASTPVTAQLTAMLELPLSVSVPAPRTVTIPANGRVSVPLSSVILQSGFPAVAIRAGVEVRETTAVLTGALVVEGAIYWNSGGQVWGAGASLPASRVP